MSDRYGAQWGEPRPQYPAVPGYPANTGSPTGPGYPAPPDTYGWGSTPYPPAPPPPEARKRRIHPAILIVAGIVVAAVVVGILVAVLAKGEVIDAPNTGGRRIAIPAAIPGYPAVTGVNTDDLLADLGDELAKDGEDPDDVVAHGAVGVFEQTASGSRVAFVGIALRDVSSLRSQVRSDGVEATLKFFLAGAGQNAGGGSASTAFDPGPRKGFLRCSTGKVGGTAATVCGWGDESAFALTIFTKAPSLAAAAGSTRTLRAAIESA